MSYLKERFAEIKRIDAFEECFDGSFYNVCPVLEFEGKNTPTFDILRSAHCINFNKFTAEDIVELKRLTQEVIDYVGPITESTGWWRTSC
tara:strand:+ start:997 stop:1266 length:270 start_codon:yes stop_codon:yes gene_type:complete